MRRPRFSRIRTKGQARHWRAVGAGMSRRHFGGWLAIHECICIHVVDTCLRRRNLSLIEIRPFLQRWLQACEPGLYRYLVELDRRGSWRDLKNSIAAVAQKSFYTVPNEYRNLTIERQLNIAACLEDISAIGSYWATDPTTQFVPEPDPAPESDKDGSGSGEGNGGTSGTAGGANAAPAPSLGESQGEFIPSSEDELAALLDAAEDEDAGPSMGAML